MKQVQLSSYAIDAAKSFYRGEGLSLTERKATENDNTMVTVVCITYKHEEYIAQALDSFIMQKTDFKFKVFVGEDHGPDGTADIIREYAEKYPDIIVPFIREQNMGAQRNLVDLCQRATSPYIAFCEGDDYWIDEYKLQKQVDQMERELSHRACFHNTEIIAPEDWYLNSFYHRDAKGRRLIPYGMPNVDKKCRLWSAPKYIITGPAHTSSMLFRWNYDVPIPEEFYIRESGDHYLMMLQLGKGNAFFMPDVMSAYRRADVGVTMFDNKNEHFFRTRLNWINVLEDLKVFYAKYYGNYCRVAIENRCKLEAANYLDTLIHYNDTSAISQFFEKYPDVGKICLTAYISFYRDQRLLTQFFSWQGYRMIARNRYFRHLIKPFVNMALLAKKAHHILKKKSKHLISTLLYWIYTPVRKDNNLWVFSGFNKKSYMDNTMYLYEYILKNHPEIRAVWVTLNNDVFEQLKSEGKPVVKMRTKECRKIVSHAAVGIMDHFRMSDYEALSGLNDRLKIVQLWHGVGLKTMQGFHLTNVPGVQFSDDILCDGQKASLVRKIRYFLRAPHRELMEHYLFQVCTGDDNIDEWKTSFHLTDDQVFVCGYPRTANMLQLAEREPVTHPKILYAPTYRWSIPAEQKMVADMIDGLPAIQKYMEEIDGEFVIQLHPHTWRDYESKIVGAICDLDRISCNTSKGDIYQSLHTYSILISDYSSIAYDFLLLDRPLIFLCSDYEEFVSIENSLRHDYMQYSPGLKAFSWQDVLSAIRTYTENPELDAQWRTDIRKVFFDMNVNTVSNSERIVSEIQNRLSSNI